MNLEKLENKCQFCKNYNHFYRKRKGNCLLDENSCSLQIWTVGYAKDQNLAITWELHPDIADTETTELEKILCAAIWYKELPREIDARGFQPVNTDVGIVVTGYRHGNCIATVKELSGLRSVKLAHDGVGELKQGFLTNKNRFVDRQEAMIIARKANQLINEDHTDTLFSEDLY